MLLCFCIIPFKRREEELITELEATDSPNCVFVSLTSYREREYCTNQEYKSADWCLMCDEYVCMVFRKLPSTLYRMTFILHIQNNKLMRDFCSCLGQRILQWIEYEDLMSYSNEVCKDRVYINVQDAAAGEKPMQKCI